MPAGVCTFCELSVPFVARLAETLGLPGRRRRPSTRPATSIPQERRCEGRPAAPSCYRVNDETDLKKAASVVGFPAVLKPLNGAASLGVKKVDSEAELQRCYADVWRRCAPRPSRRVPREEGPTAPSDPNEEDPSSCRVSIWTGPRSTWTWSWV